MRTTHLPYYPSASAVEWHRNRLFVMGDDAPDLLVLNRKHRQKHLVPVFASKQRRLSPAEKPDIEAAVLVSKSRMPQLLLLPSFSTQVRSRFAAANLTAGAITTSVHKSAFPAPTGLQQVNIEGATSLDTFLLLANRGHLAAPYNHLLVAEFDTTGGVRAWNSILPIELPATPHFAGVSGLHYVAGKDLLLFTASTELTTSANADGAIGNSYLGYVSNLRQQLKQGKITADVLIDLVPVLQAATPQKIESVTVEKVKSNTLILHLAADNDNGQSNIFKLRLKVKAQQ